MLRKAIHTKSFVQILNSAILSATPAYVRSVTSVLRMPQLSPSMENARILKWHKKEGDLVQCYDLLFTCSTGTLTQEESRTGKDQEVLVESSDEGYLARIHIGNADRLVVGGETLAVFVDEEEEIAGAAVMEPESPELQSMRTLMWQAFLP
eukprot:gb/GEZN01024977.1/.p1 GENE.gb/GEZN01024977.1/~~gb/GEZN01024977.1/.p1  ORF type:complete len:151 (+),score=17.34 gb/GEZN01024977.1/:52-504(+)